MSSRPLEILSPAKLNLFLHITGQRADGYHNLQTLFQFIDLCDQMVVEANGTGKIALQFPDASVDTADNLVTRAAKALQLAAGCARGATISVTKRIPMGGGLGGGSSNAASTLVALNYLWRTGLNNNELCQIGLKLGADVPIFIHGHAAIAEGVGEIFEDVAIDEPWYLLLVPACHVPTARLFQEKQLTRDSKPINLCAFLKGAGHNDFEPVTRKLFPEVEHAMQLLNHVGKAVMTGTGACVFASYPSAALAEQAAKQLKHNAKEQGVEPLKWQVVKGRNLSPLYSGILAAQR